MKSRGGEGSGDDSLKVTNIRASLLLEGASLSRPARADIVTGVVRWLLEGEEEEGDRGYTVLRVRTLRE